MNHATTSSMTLIGINGHPVLVEAELVAGRAGIVILDPDGRSLEQTRDRVGAAIVNSGLGCPREQVRITLAPSGHPTPNSSTDLAMAAGILAILGAVPHDALTGLALIGELGLDGSVRPVRGVLPMASAAAQAGAATVAVPAANAHEAQLVAGVQVLAIDSLNRLVEWACTGVRLPDPPAVAAPRFGVNGAPAQDLADLTAAMSPARRALEIAAAGGHHLGMVGPLGSGKTMLAQRLPSVLPDLGEQAALEVTAVRSAAGLLPPGAGLVRRPPFQAPHHTASVAALIGGGPRASRPGSVSLAHHGVFYVDDAPEFVHQALWALRQPVDDGRVTLAGAGLTVSYPARVQMVLAAQPCPCINPAGEETCGCDPQIRSRYLARMSELWQRTDIRLRLTASRSRDQRAGEASAVVAHRVARARAVAADRWRAFGYPVNAAVPGTVLRKRPWRLPDRDVAQPQRLVHLGIITAGSYDRVLRLAWSISDLHGHDRPTGADVDEATTLHLDQAR